MPKFSLANFYRSNPNLTVASALVGVATVGLLAVSVHASNLKSTVTPLAFSQSSKNSSVKPDAEQKLSAIMKPIKTDMKRSTQATSPIRISTILTGGEHAKSLGIAHGLETSGEVFSESLRAKVSYIRDRAISYREDLDRQSGHKVGDISIFTQQFITGTRQAAAGLWSSDDLERHIDAFTSLDEVIAENHKAWMNRLSSTGISKEDADAVVRLGAILAVIEYNDEQGGGKINADAMMPARVKDMTGLRFMSGQDLGNDDMMILETAAYGMMSSLTAKMHELKMTATGSMPFAQTHYGTVPSRLEVMGPHYAAIQGISESFMSQEVSFPQRLAAKVVLMKEVSDTIFSLANSELSENLHNVKSDSYLSAFQSGKWNVEKLEAYIDDAIDLDIAGLTFAEVNLNTMTGSVEEPRHLSLKWSELLWAEISKGQGADADNLSGAFRKTLEEKTYPIALRISADRMVQSIFDAHDEIRQHFVGQLSPSVAQSEDPFSQEVPVSIKVSEMRIDTRDPFNAPRMSVEDIERTVLDRRSTENEPEGPSGF